MLVHVRKRLLVGAGRFHRSQSLGSLHRLLSYGGVLSCKCLGGIYTPPQETRNL